MIEQVMEVCGCSREAAERAAATRSPGVDLAVDLVLSTMSTHTSLPSGFDAPPQPAKLVCLVRKDLGMGTGKVAAQAITERASVSGTPENAYARLPPLQVAHGALAAYRAAVRRRDAGDASVPFRSWEEGGEPTVVLGVEDEARASAQLDGLLAQAEARGLPTERVADAGRTEVAAGSVTVGTIGPANNSEIDVVTGGLSLL
ncbi:hypothetical protein EMIHUDRAFT_201520 [Emiliania huxleyi CCMP1516]|uniref:peptidyl-tRNA hydrolase n=2 Tax=Emiliania huxleyi TaxID=2903 RepID=A0A0D3KI43_EMIH1|nr:hypothetical protein EMIHUDRAFT_201520 [Emiliania huxleyi CCMP1516]EOD35428.1 hypothetical protein EMIHUDRAFT_201520 [Emiliania huxleyi CCMP1516]|eukprot:XP_005787857.1 hypothetical protein EMIHUDRAFT_201520 [Emiliania huxleyi CCMP1516]